MKNSFNSAENFTIKVINHLLFRILDDLGRAVEELVTVITEQESDTIDNGNHKPEVILENRN